MKIKNLVDNTTSFVFRRLSELIGLATLCLSILLLVSLISYSPEGPNFIFPENAEIKNLLGKMVSPLGVNGILFTPRGEKNSVKQTSLNHVHLSTF